MYVQYGCGLCAPPGWRNFDASPMLRLKRLPMFGRFLVGHGRGFPASVEYGDVVRGLPIPNNACHGIYCSHVLEHLSLNDCKRALRESHRILAVGGLFRLVVPDLEQLARGYLGDQSSSAALGFMRATHLGREERPRSTMALIREWLGSTHHLWMWDFKSLRQELIQADFTRIRRAQFCDSVDKNFLQVEDPKRWQYAMGIECSR
jgi:predicted SAM-dependent methyltransferase